MWQTMTIIKSSDHAWNILVARSGPINMHAEKGPRLVYRVGGLMDNELSCAIAISLTGVKKCNSIIFTR